MRSKEIKYYFLVVFCSLLYQKSTGQNTYLEGFDIGPFNVGFKYEKIVDYSRAYGDGYRPVQLFIWYPSKDTSIKIPYSQYFLYTHPFDSLQYSDYATQEGFIIGMLLLEIEIREIDANKDEVLEAFKSLKTFAQEGATPADGMYPLVLMTSGGNTQGQLHSVIAEFLASNGYVVVVFPSLGNQKGERWPFDHIGINLQMDDMAFAINHLSGNAMIDIDNICLASWSVGGVSQAIYTMKNPNIDMFISLDSGLGRVYGIEMLKESPYFDYSKVKIPYLHLTGRQPEMYQVERSNEFYDSIASQVKYSLFINDFAHQHFASQLGLLPTLVDGSNDKTILDSYIQMSLLTLTFMNAFLKEENDSRESWLEMIPNYK